MGVGQTGGTPPAPYGGPTAEQGCAADCLQRPLRFRFRQRLTPGVAMTSDVKGSSQLLMSSSLVPIASCGPSEEAEPVRHDG
jgi:hypothetical protein